MSRLSIDIISYPPQAYRLKRNDTAALSGFESETQSRSEDELRIRRINRPEVRTSLGKSRIKPLVRNIQASGLRRRRSLASALYMRNLRKRVCGQLWWLVERTANLQPRTFTLFPRGWEIPAGELRTFDPRRRLAALRSLINRAGGSQADGYLILFIHGEYDPGRQVYQLHVHGLAAGGLARVVDEAVRKVTSVRSHPGSYGLTEFVRHRLRMDGPPTNLPRPLTYLLKSYWPACVQYWTPGGRLRRQRRKTRMAEPNHTEVLLWLDQWELSDLTLMMNLSVDRAGLRLADRAYSNGDDQ